jgi:drug/metabolite transporter (DMT)-like permease
MSGTKVPHLIQVHGPKVQAVDAHSERLWADFILLIVAVIWGVGLVVQRVAAARMDPFFYNGIRFILGALMLLPLVGRRSWALERLELWGGALVGVLLFGGAGLQQVGLQFTTAGKAGFITGLYVVLVPLFLALVWRQWPRWPVWAASLLAGAGLFLLSAVERLALSPGDGWELAGAVLWALHVIFIGRLAPRVDVLRLALVQYFVCGLLSLALGFGLALGRGQSASLQGLGAAWWTVLYTSVLSIGLGYTLQAVGQQQAPATDAALIISLEAVFASVFGWLLLGETLTAQQVLGCGLMLAGMLLAQVYSFTLTSSS